MIVGAQGTIAPHAHPHRPSCAREATEKWRRATLSQVQLTSYNGYAEITALRDEMRAKQGSAFSVKRFNNQFLSYGSAPVRSIRTLMLQ